MLTKKWSTGSILASKGLENPFTVARYEIATEPRRKPQRIKESIIRFKGYLNKKLVGESGAEWSSIASPTSAGVLSVGGGAQKHQRPARRWCCSKTLKA
jgi:hypothetical protein